MASILLIDDDPNVLDVWGDVLSECGHEVVCSESSIDGLTKMEDGRFDLIVVDLFMPEKDGIETLLEIKRQDPSQKTLMISSGGRFQQTSLLSSLTMFGAEATLSKASGALALKRVVAELVDQPPEVVVH